jgi:hypothetical protein
MRGLLLVIVVLLSGAVVLKGNVGVTPDNHLRVATWVIPVPLVVQNSPVMALVTTMLPGRSDPTSACAQLGAAAVPPLPSVTTATGTYNDNRPSTGRSQPAAQFDTVAKALRGQ